MQYILTEEEYSNLKSAKVTRQMIADTKLQELCTKICNEMPVLGWDKNAAKTPWECTITMREQDSSYEWVCDECPVQSICPYPYKEYSK